jgi:hypothetical protein
VGIENMQKFINLLFFSKIRGDKPWKKELILQELVLTILIIGKRQYILTISLFLWASLQKIEQESSNLQGGDDLQKIY